MSALKDLYHYQTCDKMYWEMNLDLECSDGRMIKRNERIPCLFVVEQDDAQQRIIQIDESIASDPYRYTAFRSVLGHACGGERVGVYLVPPGSAHMYDLDGETVSFDTLLPANDAVFVSKRWVGIMEVKKQPETFSSSGFT